MDAKINYPFDPHYLLRKKRFIRQELLQKSDLLDKRIAILGGSTTAEVKDMLELFLLQDGIRPVFYESEFNRYYEDVMFPNAALERFAPDVIYIYTTSVNVLRFPSARENASDVEAMISTEVGRFQEIWDKIAADYVCPIIQNNFELPHYRGLGNLDAYDIHGRTRFITELNCRFAEQARQRQNLYLNDINYLAAWFGLERWYDKLSWYSYKYAMCYEAIPFLAHNVAGIVKAIFGKNRKCLVLDLDNTLWGGDIGEDGLNGIQIGKETPEAEAYTEFQQYIKGLKDRGIILAVCSKNDDKNAREGFTHPDSVLKLDDFSAFRADWGLKNENIRNIAKALNIGLDSIVFVDDNPVERENVRCQDPEIAVPEFGNNVTNYINIIDKAGFFETVSLSEEDLQRSTFYADNAVRQECQGKFDNYDDFLCSLRMKAEVRAFSPVYFDRITQLINKTNQFNVTTRRYTQAEVEAIANDNNYITLYGRLLDKFGDNGLISIIIGEVRGAGLHIDLWLMSCRVLKRGMEQAMFDQLVLAAQARKVAVIYGYYYPTVKNGMVSGLFEQMSFVNTGRGEAGETTWRFEVPERYTNKNQFIEVGS